MTTDDQLVCTSTYSNQGEDVLLKKYQGTEKMRMQQLMAGSINISLQTVAGHILSCMHKLKKCD